MKKCTLGLLALIIASLSSCGESSPAKIRDVYKNYFDIGAAINRTTKSSNLVNEFSSYTCENDMKWEALHPLQNSYDYSSADEYVKLAKNNNAKLRGHTLVWHQAVPSYVFNNNGNKRTKGDVLEIEKDHIKNVITHFKDDVYCWDVCNEVVDDNPSSPLKEDHSNIYRDSEWYQLCGDEYILTAFKTANDTLNELGIRDKVKLFYNDYSNTTPVKREKTIAMIKSLKDQGATIDGIGLQCHYHLGNFNLKELEESIIEYSELGLDVQITEFDCEIYDTSLSEIGDYKTYNDVPEEALFLQAEIYDRAFEVFRKYKDKISAVTFWGTTDASCYMNEIDPTGNNPNYGSHTNWPFLFNRKGEKKPCYYAICDFGQNLNQHFNPYKSREGVEVKNKYNGDGNDFHLNSFSSSNSDIVSRPEKQSDGSYRVEYINISGGYDYISTSVIGRIADFTYLNIKAKGTPGKGIAIRGFFGSEEDEYHNVFGTDVLFSLNDEFEIHTLKVKGIYQTRLDLLEKVAIYPEIGIQDAYGEFHYSDVWFSKEIPEDGILENPGVDTGETGKTVNGWFCETWTMYTIFNFGNGMTGIRYSKPKNWAYISRKLDIGETDNELVISFENKPSVNGKPSITYMHFNLVGDVFKISQDEEGYDYPECYEEEIYFYNLKDPNEVKPDESNITTLHIPLATAMSNLGSHAKEGYSLRIFIESNPYDFKPGEKDFDGEIIFTDTHLTHGEHEPNYYSKDEESSYEFKDKDGVEKNITYTDLPGDKYFAVYRVVKTNHTDIIRLKLRNNNDHAIQVGVRAGIKKDIRSDLEKNGYFYPLWEAHGGEKNPEGYYVDGSQVEIAAGEEMPFEIKVDDDDIYANDCIDVIKLIIDCCYGDLLTRSGNIDVVSLEVIPQN